VGLWSAVAAVDDVVVTLLGGGMTQEKKITGAPMAQIPVTLDQVGYCKKIKSRRTSTNLAFKKKRAY
jgi:hypothetical protein